MFKTKQPHQIGVAVFGEPIDNSHSAKIILRLLSNRQ